MSSLRRLAAHPGVALLPLRAFLGVTFVFAGLQKLADPRFFDAHDPAGLHAQLLAYARTSPVAGILRTSAHHALLLGLLIALGELAAGLGALLGLWTRAAALGGMLLSAGFLLGVSWHTHPFYLGPDIFSLFAWTPLLVLGAGGVLSLDARLAADARRALRLAPAGPVAIDFANVRRLCGEFDRGRCRARGGAACAAAACPVLVTPVRPAADVAAELDRRTLLARGGAAAAAGVAALVGGGVVAGAGRLLGGTSGGGGGSDLLASGRTPAGSRAARSAPPSSTPSPSTTASPPATAAPPRHAQAAPTTSPTAPPPRGAPIGPASAVPIGGAARFIDPRNGDPSIVVQPSAGRFVAHSAVCTHAGCTVRWAGGGLLACPCHGARFDAITGQVLRGPAEQPLPGVPLTEGSDGQLYVT